MCTKSALDLLAAYGDDSSDDEVPGCRVSTKRLHKDDDDITEDPPLKRHERFPVPFFATDKLPDEVTDDPALHHGRIRSFAHERGNWATYVYIPCDLTEGLEKLINTILEDAVSRQLGIQPVDDLHISLTKTVILRHHWIDSFVNTVKGNLLYFTKFMLMYSSLDVYCNEERTRTFLGLKIKTGLDTLLKLVNCMDNSLQEFNLPTFYENPSLHMSIAWCLGDERKKLEEFLDRYNQILEDLIRTYPQDNWFIYVEEILCKSGNKIFKLYLT